ncbi:hypothetical protein KJ612_04095 [Myxococcota bacterium]|nr:hypothetical protein [Myxococcota bacterium]MBU1411251.1 hypothetical protein [Myxococcota bacterium]
MGTHARRIIVLGALALTILLPVACAEPGRKNPAQVQEWNDMDVMFVFPSMVLPGSRLWIEGGPFPDESFGPTEVVLEGTFHHDDGFVHVFESLPAVRTRADRVYVDLSEAVFTRICGGARREGQLLVNVWVRSTSLYSGKAYTSSALPADLTTGLSIGPVLTSVQLDPFVYLEGGLTFSGQNLLLSADEGESVAVIEGCLLPEGSTGSCETDGVPIGPVELPLTDLDPRTRDGGTVVMPSHVFGVHPASFSGTIRLRNHPVSGSAGDSPALDLNVELLEVELTQVSTSSTSLGGFVDIHGHAFVPAAEGCSTDLTLQGTWTPEGGVAQVIDMSWIPEIESGELARHVLDEQSDLGELLDLRTARGLLDVDLSARVCCGAECEESNTIPLQLEVLPVLQKVFLAYQDSYASALAQWGLTGLDAAIRDRALEVIRGLYAGIHLELDEDEITDYKLYSRVEIHGFDPNGFGLLGYDNSTGKDVGNQRLHDVLGGRNAVTQEDGYPGYGGVFLHSFFGLSQNPPTGVTTMEIADPLFDRIFDPFRPDRRGTPVNAQEAASFTPVSYGPGCATVGSNRLERVACAVYALGTLLGTTLAHEIGHSLGLAQPYVEGSYHNPGDVPLRLMDAGNARPFSERAGISAEGFESFCSEDFLYLRAVLPHPTIEGTPSGRPGCGQE